MAAENTLNREDILDDTSAITLESVWNVKGPGAPSALDLKRRPAVLDTMGIGGSSGFGKDLPLLIAFAVLAAYTYSSGLRAPALIAFVKDTLVYIVVIVAVIYIPIRLGGYGHIFHDAATSLAQTSPATGKPKGSLITGPKAQWSYATLALGSAMALFMYPHSATGVLAAKSRTTVRRNLAVLPAYSLMLGLLSLLGFMAISAGVGKGVKGFNAQLAVQAVRADQAVAAVRHRDCDQLGLSASLIEGVLQPRRQGRRHLRGGQ